MTTLAVRDVKLRRGTREILRGVTFDVEPGEILALMGLSGGGKTTVLRTVAALETFEGGSIDVGGVVLRSGHAPSRATIRELRR